MKKKLFQCFLCMLGLILIEVFTFAVGYRNEQSHVTLKQSENDIEKAFENVLCSCVRIQGNGHYGSGNIIQITKEEIIIVTNKHMLQYMDENSYITFYDMVTAEGSVRGVSDTLDVGFITIKRSDAEETTQYRSVRMDMDAYDTLKKNDSFFMIDMATDVEKPEIYNGEVIEKSKYLDDYQTEMFYADAYAKPGMSGCGLFDERGNYIGILSGGTPYVEIAAVGLDRLLEEYEKTEQSR